MIPRNVPYLLMKHWTALQTVTKDYIILLLEAVVETAAGTEADLGRIERVQLTGAAHFLFKQCIVLFLYI